MMTQFKSVYLAEFGKHWGWFLIWGIILVILGSVAIGAATLTTIISIIFFGFLLLVSGMVIIIDAFTFWWKKWAGFLLHLFIGGLYFAAGLTLIKNPIFSSIAITTFLGLFFIIVGIFRVIYSLSLRTPRWGWIFFNGIISLLLGILIMSNIPEASLFIIGLFIGIDLIFSGWTYIMASLAARSLK